MYSPQKYQSLTTCFLLLFIAAITAFPKLSSAQSDPELKARALFDEGNYEQAIPFFKDLVNLYPKDERLNYYYAACLVETKHFSEETEMALQNAFGKETPAKVYYYQGQFLHATENYSEALHFYEQFKDEAKRKVVKETKVDELIKLCTQGVNPFPKPQKEEPVAEEKPAEAVAETTPLVIPEALKDTTIRFQVTPTIRYLKIDQFKEQSSVQAFIKGWQLEQDLNQLLDKTNTLRAQYENASALDRDSLAQNIIQLEKETYQLNQQTNTYFAQAREKELAHWDQAQPQEVSNFMTHIQFMEDSIANAKQTRKAETNGEEAILKLPEQVAEEILPEATQPVGDQIVYKIQIGAYSKTPPDWVQRLFKKLSVIRRIDQYTDENGVTVYTVGELTSFDDALQMRSQVRTEGVKDAFVAAYKNGERIPVKQARKLTETGG